MKIRRKSAKLMGWFNPPIIYLVSWIFNIDFCALGTSKYGECNVERTAANPGQLGLGSIRPESTRPGQLVVKPWTLGQEVSGSRSCRVAAHCGPEQVTFKQLLGLMTKI